MVWMLRHIHVNGKRKVLTTLVHGTMANAYPQAIGIAKAMPDRQVVAMCGDGGMSMLMGDLLTLVQENLPIKLFIFNNGQLGFVQLEQRADGLLDAFTDLKNPDFGKVAEAIGMKGMRVTRPENLDGAVRETLAHNGPALLDVTTNKVEFVWPGEIQVSQVAGMTLYGARAVLNGRLEDVVDMMRDNFLR
jgi:pyruvate dehydrogenase (quinone)